MIEAIETYTTTFHSEKSLLVNMLFFNSMHIKGMIINKKATVHSSNTFLRPTSSYVIRKEVFLTAIVKSSKPECYFNK